MRDAEIKLPVGTPSLFNISALRQKPKEEIDSYPSPKLVFGAVAVQRSLTL